MNRNSKWRCRRVHPHLVIAESKVQLGEEMGAKQLVQELIDGWNGELILGRLGIEGPVVNAELLGVVWLAHQEHQS